MSTASIIRALYSRNLSSSNWPRELEILFIDVLLSAPSVYVISFGMGLEVRGFNPGLGKWTFMGDKNP
jgi:ABC-type phosphate transport system permease subunit